MISMKEQPVDGEGRLSHELRASKQASKDGMAMVFSLRSISPSFIYFFILSFLQLLLYLRVVLACVSHTGCRQVGYDRRQVSCI